MKIKVMKIKMNRMIISPNMNFKSIHNPHIKIVNKTYQMKRINQMIWINLQIVVYINVQVMKMN